MTEQIELAQKEHYDTITDDYARHYGDLTSATFYEQFIFKKLFAGISFQGAKTLDAMCGPGIVSKYLSALGAETTGLDISENLLNIYVRNNPTSRAVQGSMLATPFEDKSFDAVVILGGLHHLHPHVDQCILEVHRILKPGGYFLFFEPPAGTLPDLARKAWYKVDRLFEANEKSIDLKGLGARHASRFEWLSTAYGGGPAYFLIYNSLVLRIPIGLKRYIARPLFAAEAALDTFLPTFLSSYACARLRKKP